MQGSTNLEQKTLNPKWNESFTFHVGDLGREKLRIAVWDHDTLSRVRGSLVCTHDAQNSVVGWQEVNRARL